MSFRHDFSVFNFSWWKPQQYKDFIDGGTGDDNVSSQWGNDETVRTDWLSDLFTKNKKVSPDNLQTGVWWNELSLNEILVDELFDNTAYLEEADQNSGLQDLLEQFPEWAVAQKIPAANDELWQELAARLSAQRYQEWELM
jgi:hypothetical protein